MESPNSLICHFRTSGCSNSCSNNSGDRDNLDKLDVGQRRLGSNFNS